LILSDFNSIFYVWIPLEDESEQHRKIKKVQKLTYQGNEHARRIEAKTSNQSKAMGVGLSEKLLNKAPIRFQILYGTIPNPHFSLLTIKNLENTVWAQNFQRWHERVHCNPLSTR
jgi:hypothetical protein